QGADVNCLHGTLKPLHCACMVADADCVELLLHNGAEVNSLDGYSRTALHYCAESDAAWCVALLLAHGADPNAGDGNGDTPLHWAAFRNSVRGARALLTGGALVNARDHNGDTPLSWAALRAHRELLALLLQFGAEARVRNRRQESPAAKLAPMLLRARAEQGRDEQDEEDEEDMGREEACLQLLLRAAGQLELRHNGHMPAPLRAEPELCRRLSSLCSVPAPLQSLARCAVRRSLGLCFLPQAVEQLPLPTALKEYLLLL
ncbi:ASB8 protein, partial [Bucco capensis]|nr:ASB8 protein [Bucco capensis]